MSIIKNIKSVFAEEQVGGDHDAPEHKVDDGAEKDWAAVDFSDDDLVDDEWIENNTKVVE